MLVAWPSRFCSSGQPNYSLDSDDEDAIARRTAIADYLDIDLGTASPDEILALLRDQTQASAPRPRFDPTFRAEG